MKGIDYIGIVVANKFGTTLEKMVRTQEERSENIKFPRQVFCYIVRKHTDASLQEIGNTFGKSHATVLGAIRRVEDLIETDKAVRQAIEDIESKIIKAPYMDKLFKLESLIVEIKLIEEDLAKEGYNRESVLKNSVDTLFI